MSIYRRFVPLAMRAALKLPTIKEASIRTVGPERVAGLMDVWLIALEPRLAHAARIFPDRAIVERLCEESADLCSILESEALETEHNAEAEERQRLDPRNWPPLRQYYESFKATKGLLAQAPEEIPESLVRDVLAQQYGIKPEEVTEKQIIFEVSGLLPTGPSIKVVPMIGPAVEKPEPSFSDQHSVEQLNPQVSPGIATRTTQPSKPFDGQRNALLDEYKGATGNPSNRRIYRSENAPINKPEFYAWLHGELASTSKTTIKFENFLRRKKPPIP